MAKNTEFKNQNITTIKNYFFDDKTHTKNELAHLSGLSLAATTNALLYLSEQKDILYVGESKSTGGRKSKEYVLNKDKEHILLINLLKSKKEYRIAGLICNLSGETVDKQDCISQKGELEEITSLIRKLMDKDDTIQSIEISIPGVCENGHIDICDYESLAGFDIVNYLEEIFKVDVVVENDVNVASIGLSYQYPGIKHLAFVYQPSSDFVGCGMIIDGHLHNGYSHFAGELRYLPFYNHLEQINMLKEEPEELLRKQILTLCAVINPELIGYCSDVFDTSIALGNTIDAKHLPQLIRISDYEKVLKEGLFNIAINNLKKRGIKDE